MFAGLQALLVEWLARESAAGLMMLATAVMLFAAVFMRLRQEEQLARTFLTPFFLGIVHALVFIGITGAFYVLLDTSYKAFQPLAFALTHGEAFEQELANSRKNWGQPLTQQDLTVIQNSSHVEVVEVSRENDKTLYINQTVMDPVEQESIVRFEGLVTVHVVDQRLGTYILDANYEYEVVNPSDRETTASFQFPIGLGRIYRNLRVTVDGKDLGSQKRILAGMLTWEQTLQPQERLTITISFETQGMELYAFQIPEKKPIRDFSLTLDVDSQELYVFSKPESTAIRLTSNSTPNGFHIAWEIQDSIIAPEIGIILKSTAQADADQERVLKISKYMPRGLMLLLSVVVFTLLICSVPVNLWRLALLAAVFSASFLLLMGLDLLQIDHSIVLPLLAIPALVLILMIYRDLPRLPLVLIFCSASIFLLAYPCAGLLPEGPKRIALDSLVQALIILYIFVLAFTLRVRRSRAAR